MPSSNNYNRDYKTERKTAKKRGETGVGSKSGDATRHRARRLLEKELGKKIPSNMDVNHKKTLKSGGSNSTNNLNIETQKKNRSEGGRIGNKKGKSKK